MLEVLEGVKQFGDRCYMGKNAVISGGLKVSTIRKIGQVFNSVTPQMPEIADGLTTD